MGVQDIQVVEEQSALLRVAMLVARDTPLPQLFTAVAAEGARVLGVDAGGVLRYVGAERAVVVGVWRGDGKRKLPVNAELDFHRMDSAIGRVRADGRPSRVVGYERARGDLPAVMKSLGMHTSVAAPIFRDQEVWGALVATSGEEEGLPPGSEQRLVRLDRVVTPRAIHGAERHDDA